jgi:L-lysine exporter family protein LysE/ArgO
MEIFYSIINGLILGFGLMIPLGMQNIFVLNQGIAQKNFKNILPCIITAAICDTLLIIIGVLGVSLLILELSWLKIALMVIGLFFLLYISYTNWNMSSSKIKKEFKAYSAKKQIIFTVSVSIFNPHAITDTIMVIGGNSIQYSENAKLAYTLSCIITSWIWFFGLAYTGNKLGKLDKTGHYIKLLNKIAAILMLIVALYLAKQIFNEIF